MDFDRLRAFVWILEEGSFSAAARRLRRTQPAVTRMLQILEVAFAGSEIRPTCLSSE